MEPVWSYWSPIGCLPRWRIGERSPDMGDTGEIKYPGKTKTSTTALWLAEGSVRARGRKPRRQITWPSRLGVVRGASNPSMEKELKLKKLTVQIYQDGLNGIDDGEDNGIRIPNFVLAPGTLKPYLNLAKCKNLLKK